MMMDTESGFGVQSHDGSVGLVSPMGEPLLSPTTGEPIVAHKYRSLREMDFTDLFFSVDGEATMRGLEDEDTDEDVPLTSIPETVMDDLLRLHTKVCSRGMNEEEFFEDYDDVRFRVSRIDEVNNTWFALRRLMWPIPRLGGLGGIPTRVIEYLGMLGRRDQVGLIIISGATSQGKTTTASALLCEYMIKYGNIAVTVEDPPELPLSGPHGRAGRCFQTQAVNGDFGLGLKKTMRRAPRYIFLGEIRDSEGASAALRAAINGHLVITTVHAGDCIQALDSVIKLVAGKEPLEMARSNLASGLAGVVHQRFVKRRGKKRTLKVQSLFPGHEQGIRSMIRSGKTEQLSSYISQQEARLAKGELPQTL